MASLWYYEYDISYKWKKNENKLCVLLLFLLL